MPADLKYTGKNNIFLMVWINAVQWKTGISPLHESSAETKPEDLKPDPVNQDQLFYVQQGQEAMRKALSMLEDKDGWKVEVTQVMSGWLKSVL